MSDFTQYADKQQSSEGRMSLPEAKISPAYAAFDKGFKEGDIASDKWTFKDKSHFSPDEYQSYLRRILTSGTTCLYEEGASNPTGKLERFMDLDQTFGPGLILDGSLSKDLPTLLKLAKKWEKLAKYYSATLNDLPCQDHQKKADMTVESLPWKCRRLFITLRNPLSLNRAEAIEYHRIAWRVAAGNCRTLRDLMLHQNIAKLQLSEEVEYPTLRISII